MTLSYLIENDSKATKIAVKTEPSSAAVYIMHTEDPDTVVVPVVDVPDLIAALNLAAEDVNRWMRETEAPF